MAQETIEEAAEREYIFKEDPAFPDDREHKDFIRIFEKGAKWMRERMYSEDDLIAFSEWRDKYIDGLFTNNHTTQELLHKWLEQHKI